MTESKIIFFYLLVNCFTFLITPEVKGQLANENYIKTYKAIVPVAGDLSTMPHDKTKIAESVTYLDGLGRPIQSVLRENTPQGYDFVSFWVYDEYGRKAKSYLPYATTSTTGNSKTANESAQSVFYQGIVDPTDGVKALAVQQFENSELNRLLKLGSPGADWQPADLNGYTMNDHTVKKRYLFNTANEVLFFSYDKNNSSIYFTTGTTPRYYDANQLSASKTYDEANNEVIEYVDKEGRTVCKKVKYRAESDPTKNYASTYYIYDDVGQLVVVLPPEAVREILKAR